MGNHFSLKLYAVIVSFFFCVYSHASLGDLQVNSRLGEPLKAQILLIGFKNEDLASLKIQSKGDIPLQWKFNTSNGQVFLKISSDQVLNALPLRFIVVGFTSTQRLSREYSVSFEAQNQVENIASTAVASSSSDFVLGVNPIRKQAESQTGDFSVNDAVGLEKDWLSQLKDLSIPLLASLTLVALIGLWLFWRNRRRTSKSKLNMPYSDEYTSSEVTSINLSARNVMESEMTMLAELTRIRMTPGQLNAEEAKVDSIMEADVYLSYGRSDHAESVLKEAIEKSPLDAQYHLKLLDIFANEKNVFKFDRYLLEFHKVTSGEGPAWDKAITLGRKVGSNHKLLASGVELIIEAPVLVTKSKNNFDQLLANTSSNAIPVQPKIQRNDFEFESQMVSLNQPSSIPSPVQVDFSTPKKEVKAAPPVSKKDPRLDLARVYLEMGDKAQAKIILLSFLDEATVKRIFDI